MYLSENRGQKRLATLLIVLFLIQGASGSAGLFYEPARTVADATWLILVIPYLIWVYRANRTAHSLGSRGMKYTPGWAVGWYFVPLMNLFKPYMVMKEIWQFSHPIDAKDPWRFPKPPRTLICWWISFLLSFSALEIGGTPIRSVQSIAWVFEAIAAFFAAAIVDQVQVLQKAKLEDLRQGDAVGTTGE